MQEDKNTEKIGGVTLDFSYYSGQDFYCDGDVEDELLEIAQTSAPENFDSIIRERKDWPTLYHLSSIRGNIVDWIPFKGDEKVLEIGAGPGAITGTLSKHCGSVTCVELSEKRSRINAWRHKKSDNIRIMVGNFEDIEPNLDKDYDYIFLIGVLEYAGLYIHSSADPYYEELMRILPHLKKDTGRLVIAIENRLGMKYWAGCREDHSGRYFDGIESYQNGKSPAKTFSRPALERLIRRTGSKEYSFYYPYPDYKFMHTLYSDRHLPGLGELSDNIRNFDLDRLLLFNERKAYKGMTEDGLYPLFANSFEIVIGPELPVLYSKYSNDRALEYQIRTDIVTCEKDGRKTREVRKIPISEFADTHVKKMPLSAGRLKQRYEGTEEQPSGESADGKMDILAIQPILQIADCRLAEDGKTAVFPYVEGKPLQTLLDTALEKGDADSFLALLDEYMDRVGANEDFPMADYDMTFSNILVNREVWTAIDYEWAENRVLPVKEQLFRALLVYFLEDDRRRALTEKLIGNDALLERIGISAEEAKRLTEDEMAFQDKVTGGNNALSELRAQLGAKVIKPAELQTEGEKRRAREGQPEDESISLATIQVYFDTGKGYNEQEAYFEGSTYGEEGIVTFTVDVPRTVRRLRVDPALCPCIVLLRDAKFLQADKEDFLSGMKNNGHKIDNAGWLFTTGDPNMEWDMKRLRRKAGLGFNVPESEIVDTITLTLQMTGIPATMAQSIHS